MVKLRKSLFRFSNPVQNSSRLDVWLVGKEAQVRDAEDERGDGVRSPFTTRTLFSVVMQQRERCPVGSPAADRK